MDGKFLLGLTLFLALPYSAASAQLGQLGAPLYIPPESKSADTAADSDTPGDGSRQVRAAAQDQPAGPADEIGNLEPARIDAPRQPGSSDGKPLQSVMVAPRSKSASSTESGEAPRFVPGAADALEKGVPGRLDPATAVDAVPIENSTAGALTDDTIQRTQLQIETTDSSTPTTNPADGRTAPPATPPTTASGERDTTAATADTTSSPAATSPAATSPAAAPPAATNAATGQARIDAATRAAASASMDLLESGLGRQDSALQGNPLSLQESLGAAVDRNQRISIASAYWKLSMAVARYNWAFAEWKQMDAVPATRQPDSAALSSASAAAQAKAAELQVEVIAAQYQLVEAIGQSGPMGQTIQMGQTVQSLPTPMDLPLVGPYRTYFDTLFAGRAVPLRMRAIDASLPIQREAIDLRCAAVQAAASNLAIAEQSYAAGSGALDDMLRAYTNLSQQRQAFLQSVQKYNLDIVEYAMTVAGPDASSAVLVTMLTRTKPATNSSSTLSGPAHVAGGQPTLADPTRDTQVMPAGGVSEEEWRRIPPRETTSPAAGSEVPSVLRPIGGRTPTSP